MHDVLNIFVQGIFIYLEVVEIDDIKYMSLALELAQKGEGMVSPNPMVGAIVVKEGRIIGSGWHQVYGGLHAERNALNDCTESPACATMYVTLEPCSHYGKQPPCTDAIIKAGITRVVIGAVDPNPAVAGKGIEKLRQSGIQVTIDVLHEKCIKLNQVFFRFMKYQRPYVFMKYAMTMDGKIATHTGESKWITNSVTRQHTNEQRGRYSAIMIGIGTVIADDPLLTCRTEGRKNPVRIICDTNLRTPKSAKIITTARDVPTIIATCCTDIDRQSEYRDFGCRILTVPKWENGVDLSELTIQLAKEGIDSILLEGGGTLNWSALKSGIVQKVQAYIAPKLFGGQDAKTPIGGEGFSDLADCITLTNSTIKQIGEDFFIESEVVTDVYRNC